jgi:hypothetical protein
MCVVLFNAPFHEGGKKLSVLDVLPQLLLLLPLLLLLLLLDVPANPTKQLAGPDPNVAASAVRDLGTASCHPAAAPAAGAAAAALHSPTSAVLGDVELTPQPDERCFCYSVPRAHDGCACFPDQMYIDTAALPTISVSICA